MRVDATAPPPLERDRLNEAERKRHANVLNELGLHAYAAGQTAQAVVYFALSLEMHEEPIVAESVALAYAGPRERCSADPSAANEEVSEPADASRAFRAVAR